MVVNVSILLSSFGISCFFARTDMTSRIWGSYDLHLSGKHAMPFLEHAMSNRITPQVHVAATMCDAYY